VVVAGDGHERVWTVVAPSGARLYSYADARTAEAEAAALTSFGTTPYSRTAERAHLAWERR
jgi:hypothetical protein